jgi:hypothetical protein
MDSLMMRLQEAQRRDRILRAYLIGRDWDLDGEQRLVRHLVHHSHALLPRWPFLVGYEWGPPGGTCGDLLFSNGQASLAVVEIKSLAKTPNRKRNMVERQVVESAERAMALWPEAEVTELVYTDDEYSTGAPPRDPSDRARY